MWRLILALEKDRTQQWRGCNQDMLIWSLEEAFVWVAGRLLHIVTPLNGEIPMPLSVARALHLGGWPFFSRKFFMKCLQYTTKPRNAQTCLMMVGHWHSATVSHSLHSSNLPQTQSYWILAWIDPTYKKVSSSSAAASGCPAIGLLNLIFAE